MRSRPEGRRLAAPLACAAAVVAGCASFRLPAPVFPQSACITDPAVAGVWTDTRLTQLGPVWERLSLTCDCRFDVRFQLLWFRITETGQYLAKDGAIRFERQAGPRTVPYQLEAGVLRVTDAPGEVITYVRSGRAPSCGVPSKPEG